MKMTFKLLITLFISIVIYANSLLAYTVTYDQTVKSSFAPEIKMQVWFKDNLLRIESNTGGNELIIIGNNSGTFYYLPSRNMATKVSRTKLNEDYIKYPEKYKSYLKMQGAKNIDSAIVAGEKCDVYEYIDNPSGALVTSFLSPTKKLPLKMIIENSFGNVEILFKNIKIGEDLPDNIFRVPDGVKIVDTEAIQKT